MRTVQAGLLARGARPSGGSAKSLATVTPQKT
jgi:hypothetical protein